MNFSSTGRNDATVDDASPIVPSNQRMVWLDAAKGLSILLVAFHHAELTATSIGEDWAGFDRLSAFFQPIRMPLFFLISGMLAASAVSKSWRELAQSKIAYFLYLYGLWSTIIWICYSFIGPDGGRYTTGSSVKQLITMWIIPISGTWFLWLLAIYFVLAKCLNQVKSVFTFILLVVFTTVAVEVFLYFPHSSWRSMLIYAPFFVGGLWYSRYIVKYLPRYISIAFPLVAILYYAAINYVGLDFIQGSSEQAPAVRLTLSAIGLILGLGAAFLLSRLSVVREQLAFLGRNTLSIYLAHGIIMTAVAFGLSQFSLPPSSPLWMTPLLLLIALPASLGIRYALGQFGDRWLYSSKGFFGLTSEILDRITPRLAQR